MDSVLAGVKDLGIDDPLTVATVYIAASPRDTETCLQRLQTEDYVVQETYWSEVDENFVLWSELNVQDFTRCVSFFTGYWTFSISGTPAEPKVNVQ